MSRKNKAIKNTSLNAPEMEKFNSLGKEKYNSLTELALGMQTQANQISQSSTVDANLRRYMISQNRMLLAFLYVEMGIVQVLIEQPVDDAFRNRFEIKSSQLSPEDTHAIWHYLDTQDIIEKYKMARKWARLFGGAGIIINTPQNAKSELRIDKINKNTDLEFYVADRWELNYQPSSEATPQNFDTGIGASDTPYNYYGKTLHTSRVLRIIGKEPPSILKLQLMGWGMSEIERLIRSLNSFIKNQDVVFELMDEAKIDVYKINGFNDALGQEGGTEVIRQQIELANQIKNYLNALVMDAEDDYQQKTIAFTGLPEMLTQIRQNIAADLKMPMTKLFGISSAGFNSGEDDIENYNAMIESEIRSKDKQNLIKVIKICCQKLFGFVPDDLDIVFPPLRMLTSEQEQNIKMLEWQRVMEAWDRGLITDEEVTSAINTRRLLPIDIGDAGK